MRYLVLLLNFEESEALILERVQGLSQILQLRVDLETTRS